MLNADGPDPATLRAAGWWPLLTPGTVALLPLGDADSLRAGLSGKWRNRLARAEEAGMRVTRRPLPPDPDHWVLAAEARQARARGYRGWPPRLAAAYAAATPGGAQLFVAERAGVPLAGLVLLVHEGSATWQIGVSGPEGRQAGAMPLLLWRAMLWAAARGLAQLDLGTLNTDDAPGLARFKLGTGARAHRLGGTWLHAGALAPLARRLPRAWT
ncbi:hypothetical protein RISW2_04485 [Roseivivax isoporae LMG 25204]|uniref:BioF2-like acetyltransferase domain-containing protein n=1 Tax=Roseivivax isoporae LMG 25204 TaxID=1449351 RepID=X7F756_9RHOB|nr:hypothetical protein RISW2_04485 [Roseivivax isoporae LMG 25204]